MTDETMKLKEVVVSHDADDTLTVCTACAYALATLKRMPSDWKAEGEADLERVIAALLHKLAPNHEFAAMWIADASPCT